MRITGFVSEGIPADFDGAEYAALAFWCPESERAQYAAGYMEFPFNAYCERCHTSRTLRTPPTEDVRCVCHPTKAYLIKFHNRVEATGPVEDASPSGAEYVEVR